MMIMSDLKVSISPMLSVRRGAQAIDFYKAAFGAQELFRLDDPSGSVVCQMSIAGAEFWLSDESPSHGNFSPETLKGATTRLILTTADPDSVVATAVAVGAQLVYPVEEANGWRVGRIADPFGHHWEIGFELSDEK
jgi:PhnB protein